MNINITNTSFGHKIPTEPLLKSALGIHKFDDAKILNNSIGVTVSGHISFHKRAAAIAQNILEKNPYLQTFVESIKSKSSEDIHYCIKRFTENNGKYLDLTL